MKFAILSAALFASVAVAVLPAQANEDAASDNAEQKSADIARTNEIAAAIWPLKQANVELCGKHVVPSLGFQSAVSPENKPLAVGIAEGSPAQAAGLQNFDELVAINGVELASDEQAQLDNHYQQLLHEQAKIGQKTTVKYLRNGVAGVSSITPVEACNFTVSYESEPSPYSSSLQGNHQTLSHDIDAYMHDPQQIRAYLSSALALMLLTEQREREEDEARYARRAQASSGETEYRMPKSIADRMREDLKWNLQRDNLSVYLLARTGDDVSGIADFWSRAFDSMLQTSNPMMRELMSKRLGVPERLAKIAETRKQVLALQQAGKPLLPAGNGKPVQD